MLIKLDLIWNFLWSVLQAATYSSIEEFLCQPQHQVDHVDACGIQKDDLGLGGEWMSL